ncbi:hypothetical protein VP1G_06183 [Cytospora mali]|uniref:Uncharacterized protein n=1 Tax=Cytospora mali TaxID=578113 RepID=A0A194V4T7_CYTMA|nr:hypothetical protein VP1G_06183 [Valsa mali var. pyri (nom. inval.)]
MQPAWPSPKGHDAPALALALALDSASASASTSASDPHHTDGQTQPKKKRLCAEALFALASRTNSLPDFIRALERARHPTTLDRSYPFIIRMGLFFSIMHGRTSLAAYLLENEPLAPAILREHITPSVVGQKPSIPLFDLLITQHGWDINKDEGKPHDKSPLLSWVLHHQNEHELVCWLLDRNARVDFGEVSDEERPRPLVLLETCAQFGSVESFRLLQAKGAKLGGRTLHLCCGTAAYYGADPGANSQDQDNLGREEVLGLGEEGTANVNSDADADADAEDSGLVQRPKRAAMVRYLVDELGLNVNQTDTEITRIYWRYGTPLNYAAREKKGVAVVRWLLGKGADPLNPKCNVSAEKCAKVHECHEVLQVLEQWKELNPDEVQKRHLSGSGFETPLK